LRDNLDYACLWTYDTFYRKTEVIWERNMKLSISDEYIDKIIYLMENVRDSNFAIGDVLVELVDLHPGLRTDVMRYVAGKLAMSSATLYDYENTARRWTREYREMYPALDWTIYRNSDPVTNKDMLDKCMDEGWNATTFKERMYPDMVSPASITKRVIGLLDKIIKSDVPYYIEAAIMQLIEKLQEIYDQLDDEF
jgi:hypothetical protein